MDAIQILQDNGIYASRSEAIRIALKDFLKEELEFYGDLEPETFKKVINNNNQGITKRKKERKKQEQEPKLEFKKIEPTTPLQTTNNENNKTEYNDKKKTIKPNNFINLNLGKEYLTENLIVSYLNESNELSTEQLQEMLGLPNNQGNIVKKAIGQLRVRFFDLIEINKTKQGHIYKLNKTILEKALKKKKSTPKSIEYFRESNVPKEIVPLTIPVKSNSKPVYTRGINE